MGAHPYLYFVPYNSDVNAALQALRDQEFRAGRYNPVIRHPQFPFPSEATDVISPPAGAQHKSIRHAVKAAGADGTRSILDLDHVSPVPEFNAVAPLPPEELESLFGTERPTREMIEQSDELFECIERGQGVYIIVCSRMTNLMSCFSPDIRLTEKPNQAASGNDAMMRLFHVARPPRTVLEQIRWVKATTGAS